MIIALNADNASIGKCGKVRMMKNKDKYREQIIEIAMNGDAFAVDKKTNEPVPCPRLASFCRICLFGKGTICGEARKEWLNQEVEILDEKEKAYLRAVIDPWREQVECIRKFEGYNGMEMISIVTESNNNSKTYVDFPPFAESTMYQGMEVNKEYTLEDLGL